MADAVYRVMLSLETSGSLAPGLQNASQHATAAHRAMTSLGEAGRSLAPGLQNASQHATAAHHAMTSLGEAGRSLVDTFARVGERVGEALERVADRALEVGKHLAMVGGVAGVALATYGVAHLNNELEQTQISLGAIFQAQGFAGSFSDGFKMASEQLAKMKQDVKTLPGDLGQLSNLMKMIATPAAQGGANPDEIRKLAGRTMLTGTILGVPIDVASREMANLLSGRAGAHNILGLRLGLIGEEAKKFNAASPEERLARINRELDKYQGAADKFGQSFVAQWTTLKDNIKYTLLAPITSPLFEHVKHTIAGLNSWFDTNKDRIRDFAEMVGGRLASAWDKVVAVVSKLEPLFAKMAQSIGHLSLGKVESEAAKGIGGLFGMKLLGMGISGGSEALGFGARVGVDAMRFGSLGGFSMLGTALASIANPVTIGAAAAALTALGAAAVAVVGAVHDLTDETSEFHETAVNLWQQIVSIGEDAFSRLRAAFGDFRQSMTPIVDMMGADLLGAIREMAPLLTTMASGAEAAASGLRHMLDVMRMIPGVGSMIPNGGMATSRGGRGPGHGFFTGDDPEGKRRDADEIGKAVAKHGGGGGGGGMKIDKVEIRVEGNPDPSRVARVVLKAMQDLQHNPKSSPRVRTYDKNVSF